MADQRAQMRLLSSLELTLLIVAARSRWAGKYRENYAMEAAKILAEREQRNRLP